MCDCVLEQMKRSEEEEEVVVREKKPFENI